MAFLEKCKFCHAFVAVPVFSNSSAYPCFSAFSPLRAALHLSFGEAGFDTL